tara:strand:+ start:562 stop:693 length:132 start_codon:yes stop_codon:yes gene_type:complete
MMDKSNRIVVESTVRYQQRSARTTDLPNDGEDATIGVNGTRDY